MKVPFCRPLINNDVKKEVLSCLNETGWLTTGPKVKLLEDEITELCQTNSTICVNSWTSGMLLLINWLELDENDEVIVPAYTYAASALAVINSNVKCESSGGHIVSCIFSPGRIPIIFCSRFGAIALARSVIFTEGIFGIKISPPHIRSKFLNTKSTPCCNVIQKRVISLSVIGICISL